jgi:hypothetical protein
MTAADHANTVRGEARRIIEDECISSDEDVATLRALLAQAEGAVVAIRKSKEMREAAEAERDTAVRAAEQARLALDDYLATHDEQALTDARAALSAREEGWDEEAFVAEMHRRAAREEAWTHEDRMVLGEGGC